jgi:phosphoglycolate phosphatase
MKDRFDLIIFDWDGTLVDSIDWIVTCLSKAAISCGLNAPEDEAIKNIIGLSIHESLNILFPDVEKEVREQLILHYSHAFFSKRASKNDVFQGVYEMLIELKARGFLLAVATGKSRSGLDRAMKGSELSGFFDITRCADETISKPDPKMVDEIIDELSVSRDKVVIVGDSAHDMAMAENAGIASIAVLCGANSQAQLQKYSPLFTFQQTTQLLEIL